MDDTNWTAATNDEAAADWGGVDLYFASDYAVEDYYDPEITHTNWEPVNG